MIFKFLTLDELDKLENNPSMILLYCTQRHDRKEMNSICDHFVASQCRWFSAIGIDSGLWEVALDGADIRNNPDKDDLWAMTLSDKELNESTVQFFLGDIVFNKDLKKTRSIYILGDNSEALQVLTQEILKSYKTHESLDSWEWFPEIMQALGFKMDRDHGFNAYKANCDLQLAPANSQRDQRRNDLFVLGHADRQIVGNHLFSQWRYFTHWDMGTADEYSMDYLRRVIDILNSKAQ